MVDPTSNIIAKKAKAVAKQSNHKFAHHAVFVMRGGNMLAHGHNRDTRHAEVNALNKLWPNKRKGTTVISVRYTRSGYMACAKPCPKCEEYLRKSGVKTVYYSDDNGEMQKMRM
jgi:deoxycytidylate deaminase